MPEYGFALDQDAASTLRPAPRQGGEFSDSSFAPASGAAGGAAGGAARKRPVPRGKGKDGAEKALVALLALAAVAALAVTAIFVAPPLLRITRYDVTGNVSMSREEVLSAALLHGTEYYFSLDASRVRAALEAQPRVASAEVRKLFPNGLSIAVTERAPVATILADSGNRMVAVCLDAQGVAFAEASAQEAAALPVLSGIRFEGFRMGARLPPQVTTVLASLGELSAKDGALLSAISEIRLVSGAGTAASELLIYPLGQRIPVRAGASLDAQTLRSIILVLDVLGTRGIAASVKEIDFRTGTVVYRTKEGQSD
jgi:Cell division septal protein